MNNFLSQQYKHQNLRHSVLLLLGMFLLLMFLGYFFSGLAGAIVTILLGVVTFFATPRFSPRLILSMYQAQSLSVNAAPELYKMLIQLSEKANLDYVPNLYYLPSQILNSFTVGEKENASIVLSDGLLQSLNGREMYGVLAHEVSHLANRDIRVMSFADTISRLTALMALFGYFLLIAYLPIYVLGEADYPWGLVILLVLAPNLSSLMQLALSRTREFEADQMAVQLTGDALGLASALRKLDLVQTSWLKQIFIPHYKRSDPSMLRTHPPTKERIQRLLKIAEVEQQQYLKFDDHYPSVNSNNEIKKPHRRFHGLWY